MCAHGLKGRIGRMSGLVDRAIEIMIRSQHGDDTWERIRGRAGVEVEMFVTLKAKALSAVPPSSVVA